MEEYRKGRGAQFNPDNPYHKLQLDRSDWDGIDMPEEATVSTHYFHDQPKTVLNKVDSPDIGPSYSLNPYQGCEHGCIYCYARNTHQYYGFSAGLDFESRIVVKDNVAQVLEKKLRSKNWQPLPVMVSGNTDCYQPVERKLKLTRACLEIFTRYRHPVGLITKNALILRDLDLLKDLARDRLVHVFISITTLEESLRRVMEPRTAAGAKRLQVIETLAQAGVPVGVMAAPIIPGLNDHEIPRILEAAGKAGAKAAGYTLVRLNGAVGDIFSDWIHKNFPDRADKVLRQIRDAHGGQLGDSRFGLRMTGEGKIAEAVAGLFRLSKKRFIGEEGLPPYNLDAFQNSHNGQLKLF